MRRVKRRYLALKIRSEKKPDQRQLIDTFWNALLKLYGEYGASQAGLTLISYDEERQLAVIRTTHKAVDMVRTALATITKIGDAPAAIHIITVSGTLKALYKKMNIKH